MVELNLSRPRPAPSSRNLEIYAQVKIRGMSQTQVAADNKITQSRVSRIVAQVEAWRMARGAAPEGPSNTERRRHERWLARERWEMVFQRSLVELNASARTLTSERSGERDGKAFRETTRREQAMNVQWMKTAIKAAENLVKLSELEPLAPPDTDAERLEQQREAVSKWLIYERYAAERSGRVAKNGSVHKLVEAALEALLGPEGCDSEAPPPESATERAAKLSAAIRAAEAARSAASTSPHSPSPNPSSSDRHNCHMPAAEMTPAAAAEGAADVAATPCAADPSATAPAAGSTAAPPCDPPKNPPDMTRRTEPCSVPHTTEHGSVPHTTEHGSIPHTTEHGSVLPSGREPWEDEYERLMEERKTIRLAMGPVVLP